MEVEKRENKSDFCCIFLHSQWHTIISNKNKKARNPRKQKFDD